MTSNIPIQSTAGAIPLKNEKGQVYMQKVKVNRYVTGKRPDYAADSSSEESDDEFELQQQKKAPKEEPAEEQEKKPEIKDRRLRRLQERDTTQDSDEEDRVTRHRREVIEPELIQEGSESETEARGRRDEEDSDAENEDLDEEEIERRRAILRQRALQRQEEEEILDVEEEKDDAESDEESSEYEEYSDSEEETGPRLKPVFVRKKDRITIQEKEREELKQKQLEIEAKKMAEERRKQTLKMVADEARREIEEERSMAEACDQLGSDEENDEEEYEAWKVRELRRLKRDKEEREAVEKEKSEIERMRNMTEEDRRQDLKQNPKVVTNKAPKGKYKFLQKYYHRGAFFLDEDDNRLQQDFSSATLDDHFNKTVLPKVMQVKNFGRSGRTKYTHLVDQDTTHFDAPWMTETSQNLKFHTAKGGGMRQGFERPSWKKKK